MILSNVEIIELSQNQITVVDLDIAEAYGDLAWHAKRHGKTFYARHCENGLNVYLHGLIMQPPKGLEVDHIDGNGLNNLRSNLRIVTRRQNMQNQHGIQKTSAHRGVYWNPAANKWQAYVHYGNKTKYLGVYHSQEDAAYVREFAERILNL